MPVFKPPQRTNRGDTKLSIFLAGSIEMGAAELWQDKIATLLEDDYIVYNPRRDNWDPSWEQDYENPAFYQQVNWELEHLEKADRIIFYFDPATKSPITLIELGLMAGIKPGTCMVCCPNGYWRKGNVDIVCQKYNIEQYDTFEELYNKCKSWRIPF